MMASFHHLPPPEALERTRPDITIIFPFIATSEPLIVSTNIPVTMDVGIASTSKTGEGSLQGKMMAKESMTHTANAGKGKQIKDFGEHVASGWAWEESWGIDCPMEEEIPPP